jgi:hypothetical protein
MKHYTEFITTEKELQSITCDKCHKEYLDIRETQEFLSINFTGGYGSVFGDMLTIECDICQYCLKEMIDGIYRSEQIYS